jgi:UPF0716 protein FxsA
MAIALFFVCIALPLLEIAVLVKVGQAIGFWTTLAVLIGMGVLGLTILYWQGWNTLLQAQQTLMQGEAPLGPMIDGVLLAIAGGLFLAPGLITDAVALLLLIPPVRRLIGRWLLGQLAYAEIRVEGGRAPGQSTPNGRGPVIEGEFERLDERPVDQSRRRDNRPH